MTKSTDQATSQHRDADATLMTPPLPHTRQDGHGRPGDVGDPSHAAPRSGAVRAGARVLVGRYELQQRIAVGGMAGVWRARDVVLDRIVAVKLLHEHLAVDEGFRERFRREAVTAAKLSHPHIVNLYDTGTDGEDAFLVLELVEGQTLRDLVASLGRLEPGLAAAIGEKIARALGYAHERGLVHRDVKPANILLGDDAAVKITDFGIAKADQHGDLTNTGMVLGTAAYVAPEQVLGRPVTGQADQYALGCVLYEALSGAQPFKGETAVVTAALRLEREVPPLRQLSPDVPPGLEAIVARATAREPQDRFPSLGALADALGPFVDADTNRTAALLAAHPTSDRRPSPTPTPSEGLSAPAWRARRRRVRNALPATVAALVMLAAAAVAVLGGVLDRAEDGPDATSSLAPEVLLTEDNLAVFDPGGFRGRERRAARRPGRRRPGDGVAYGALPGRVLRVRAVRQAGRRVHGRPWTVDVRRHRPVAGRASRCGRTATVRRQRARGDRRHPHPGRIPRRRVRAARPAPRRSTATRPLRGRVAPRGPPGTRRGQRLLVRRLRRPDRAGAPRARRRGVTGAASDDDLVTAVHDGDAAALDELVRRHADRVYRLCRTYFRTTADAEDAAQEAFAAIVRGIDRFRGQAAFTTWLHRVTVNACHDSARRAARRPQRGDRDPADLALPDPDDPLAEREDALRLADALGHLDEATRQAVLMHDVQGFAYAEVADTLDLPVGTVKSRIHRAHGRLARLLSDETERTQPSPARRPPTT